MAAIAAQLFSAGIGCRREFLRSKLVVIGLHRGLRGPGEQGPDRLAPVMSMDGAASIPWRGAGQRVRAFQYSHRIIRDVGEIGQVRDPHGGDGAPARFVAAGDEVDGDDEQRGLSFGGQ